MKTFILKRNPKLEPNTIIEIADIINTEFNRELYNDFEPGFSENHQYYFDINKCGFASLMTYFITNNTIIITAYKDNKIVGVCTGNKGTLSNIYVRKEYQTKGIGAALLNDFHLYNKELGAKDIVLFTCEKLVPFYKKFKYDIKKSCTETLGLYLIRQLA